MVGRTGTTIRELPEGETALAYPAMLELRPDVGSLEAFVDRVDGIQRPEGYRLFGSFDDGEADADAVAVAGFRLGHSLSWGRFLYIDDLVTRSGFRRRGHAGALLDRVREEAGSLRCDAVHLDSGHHRADAHRLYLAEGYEDIGRHFATWVRRPRNG